MLAGETQRHAASREHREPRARIEQISHLRRGGHDVLEVIEDQKELAITQQVMQPLTGEIVSGFPPSQTLIDRRRYEVRGVDAGEGNEGDASGKGAAQVFGERDGQTRLAHTPGTDERHQPPLRLTQHRAQGS